MIRPIIVSIAIFVATSVGAFDSRAQSSKDIPALFKPPANQQMESLGLSTAVAKDAQSQKDPIIIRRRFMALDADVLTKNVMDVSEMSLQAGPAQAPTVRLNMFQDVEFLLVMDRIRHVSDTLTHIIGHAMGDQQSRATLIVRDGNITGNIVTRNSFYQIRPAGSGIQSITEIDQKGFVDELEPDAPDIEPEEKDGSSLDQPPGTAPVIDVAVFYTKDAKTASPDIQAEIELAVLETNESYENSKVNQRIKLIYSEQIEYTESGNLRKDRDRLQNPNDGHMDGVHARRNNYKADLVSLWVENGSGGACGVAYIMKTVSSTFAPYGFSVVRRRCATGYYSFGHELGHNMGARHDRRVDPTDQSPFKHNHAYVNPAKRWRTIMGYNSACRDIGVSCKRVHYWSNPEVKLNGDPTGISVPSNIAADNRLTLNKTARVITGFR